MVEHDPAKASSRSTGCLPSDLRDDRPPASALAGARYVISCVRVGGLEAYTEDDIRIPLKYGVDQCVGDTICAGGIFYGQRNIPVILDFCRDIREVAEPGAKPAQLRQSHGDEHVGGDRIRPGRLHRFVPRRAARRRADSPRSSAPGTGELDFICAGINHQTWFTDIRLKWSARIGQATNWSAAFEAHPVYASQEKVRIDVLKRFGVYSTESNGHLSRNTCPGTASGPSEIMPLDRHVGLDSRRDGRLSAPHHRTAQLVRDRLSAVPGGSRGKAIDPKRSARASTPATSSRRSKPAGSTAVTSTRRTAASSPIFRPTALSRPPGFVDRFGHQHGRGA